MKKILLILSFIGYLSFFTTHEYLHYQDTGVAQELDLDKSVTFVTSCSEHENFHFNMAPLRHQRESVLHKTFSSQLYSVSVDQRIFDSSYSLILLISTDALFSYSSITNLKSVVLII